jgi:uncharacterized membrane protein
VANCSDSVIFSAELSPHRSLSARGLRNVFIFVSALAFLHIVFYVVTGAWIVLLFWGLDFLVLYCAFLLNNRAAKAREYVEDTPQRIEVRKLLPSGEQRSMVFNPFWTEFRVDRRGAFGIEHMHLAERDYAIELGAFLNPDDRESFAKALNAALIRAKRYYWH